MDMQWINQEREAYNKERANLLQLIKQNETNGNDTLNAFRQNADRLNNHVKELSESIKKTSHPEQKLKLFYQLIASKNVLDENNEMLATIDKYKDNLADPAMNKSLKAETIYYAEVANHFDSKLREMQNAYHNKAKHLALLEVNPPIEALHKLNAQELHHSHLSMQELTRSPLNKEYAGISSVMDEVSQKEYQLYLYLDNLCQSVIKSTDHEKEARNHAALVQSNTKSSNEKPKVFSNKATLFGNSRHEAANKDSIKLKSLQHDLEQRKVEIHQQLAQAKSEAAAGKMDNVKLSNLQFEDKLVNRALQIVTQTFDITKSDLMSKEYIRQQVKTKKDQETVQKLVQSNK